MLVREAVALEDAVAEANGERVRRVDLGEAVVEGDVTLALQPAQRNEWADFSRGVKVLRIPREELRPVLEAGISDVVVGALDEVRALVVRLAAIVDLAERPLVLAEQSVPQPRPGAAKSGERHQADARSLPRIGRLPVPAVDLISTWLCASSVVDLVEVIVTNGEGSTARH